MEWVVCAFGSAHSQGCTRCPLKPQIDRVMVSMYPIKDLIILCVVAPPTNEYIDRPTNVPRAHGPSSVPRDPSNLGAYFATLHRYPCVVVRHSSFDLGTATIFLTFLCAFFFVVHCAS